MRGFLRISGVLKIVSNGRGIVNSIHHQLSVTLLTMSTIICPPSTTKVVPIFVPGNLQYHPKTAAPFKKSPRRPRLPRRRSSPLNTIHEDEVADFQTTTPLKYVPPRLDCSDSTYNLLAGIMDEPATLKELVALSLPDSSHRGMFIPPHMRAEVTTRRGVNPFGAVGDGRPVKQATKASTSTVNNTKAELYDKQGFLIEDHATASAMLRKPLRDKSASAMNRSRATPTNMRDSKVTMHCPPVHCAIDSQKTDTPWKAPVPLPRPIGDVEAARLTKSANGQADPIDSMDCLCEDLARTMSKSVEEGMQKTAGAVEDGETGKGKAFCRGAIDAENGRKVGRAGPDLETERFVLEALVQHAGEVADPEQVEAPKLSMQDLLDMRVKELAGMI